MNANSSDRSSQLSHPATQAGALQAVPSVGTASMYAQQHGLAVTTEWMIGWNACLDAQAALAATQPNAPAESERERSCAQGCNGCDDCTDYEDDESNAAPAAEVVAWQPLATAPQGVRVLLGPRDAPVVGTVRHSPEWAEERGSFATVTHYNGNVLVVGYHCSEWRPLPSAAPGAAIDAREQEEPPKTLDDALYKISRLHDALAIATNTIESRGRRVEELKAALASRSEAPEARPNAAGQEQGDVMRVLEQALIRMDRARGLLTDYNPRPTCNWGMLDTADLRKDLQRYAPATPPLEAVGSSGMTADHAQGVQPGERGEG